MIKTLINNGAMLINEGEETELTMEFYKQTIKICKRLGINGAGFELRMPGIEGPLELWIWKDGRVWSGCKENIARCLEEV